MGYLHDVLPKVLWDAILWPSYEIMVFNEIEESHLLWESMLFAMDPIHINGLNVLPMGKWKTRWHLCE